MGKGPFIWFGPESWLMSSYTLFLGLAAPLLLILEILSHGPAEQVHPLVVPPQVFCLGHSCTCRAWDRPCLFSRSSDLPLLGLWNVATEIHLRVARWSCLLLFAEEETEAEMQ